MIERKIVSWRSSAVRIVSGVVSQRFVDPSRSVNRNVTVPDGGVTRESETVDLPRNSYPHLPALLWCAPWDSNPEPAD